MLIINHDNFKSIEIPYLHDGIFTGFQYQEKSHILQIHTKLYNEHLAYCLEICSVFGIDLQCCDNWGYSPNIYTWEVKDGKDAPLTQKLSTQADQKAQRERFAQAIEAIFMFTSGNMLHISCEQINVITETFTLEENLP